MGSERLIIPVKSSSKHFFVSNILSFLFLKESGQEYFFHKLFSQNLFKISIYQSKNYFSVKIFSKMKFAFRIFFLINTLHDAHHQININWPLLKTYKNICMYFILLQLIRQTYFYGNKHEIKMCISFYN